MQDQALISLLNVQIQSYLMPQTSHHFSSPIGESGIRIVCQTLFMDIFLQNLRRLLIFPYIADVEKMTRRRD
jgi:hypothetical protein